MTTSPPLGLSSSSSSSSSAAAAAAAWWTFISHKFKTQTATNSMHEIAYKYNVLGYEIFQGEWRALTSRMRIANTSTSSSPLRSLHPFTAILLTSTSTPPSTVVIMLNSRRQQWRYAEFTLIRRRRDSSYIGVNWALLYASSLSCSYSSCKFSACIHRPRAPNYPIVPQRWL